jgi:hypothetical protein
MPELSELKLTAEFINKVAADKVFFEVEKNPDHKGSAIEIDYHNHSAKCLLRLGDGWRVKLHDDLLTKLKNQFCFS